MGEDWIAITSLLAAAWIVFIGFAIKRFFL